LIKNSQPFGKKFQKTLGGFDSHCRSRLPSFWLKIFSKVTSPIFSRCFCITLRMLRTHKQHN